MHNCAHRCEWGMSMKNRKCALDGLVFVCHRSSLQWNREGLRGTGVWLRVSFHFHRRLTVGWTCAARRLSKWELVRFLSVVLGTVRLYNTLWRFNWWDPGTGGRGGRTPVPLSLAPAPNEAHLTLGGARVLVTMWVNENWVMMRVKNECPWR